MTTKIYPTYSDFLARTDKDTNGVSKSFAEEHSGYATENESNKGCWNLSDCYGCADCADCSDCFGCCDCEDCSGCSDCSVCSGCSRCSDCSGCSDCSRCSDCYRCYDCYGCYGCSDCSDCSDCSECSDCYNCYNCADCSDCYGCSDCSRKRNFRNNKAPTKPGEAPEKSWFDVPVIKNLHTLVLSAARRPGALRMGAWHTCETTHCRAGWVVTLAGEKGKALESATSTLFAAMQICKASSSIKVSPVRFFDNREVALADMERCAAEEAEAQRKALALDEAGKEGGK